MLREMTTDNDGASVMHRRRITLKDGRYMIFYTFSDDNQSAAPSDSEEALLGTETEAEDKP